MITRSKLVEQLRDYQIRSQHKYSPLTFFSPKPHIITWVDVAVAIAFALVFCMLVVISFTTLYFRRFWIFLVVVSFSIILLIRLRASRQTLARKRERRLPLSIWAFFVVISHRMYTGRQRIDISYIINLVFHEYLSAVITSVGQKKLFPTFLSVDGIHLCNPYAQAKWICHTLILLVTLVKLVLQRSMKFLFFCCRFLQWGISIFPGSSAVTFLA